MLCAHYLRYFIEQYYPCISNFPGKKSMGSKSLSSLISNFTEKSAGLGLKPTTMTY